MGVISFYFLKKVDKPCFIKIKEGTEDWTDERLAKRKRTERMTGHLW